MSSLFVTHIPNKYKIKDVEDYFSSFGQVTRCVKVFGNWYVDFFKLKDAQEAMKYAEATNRFGRQIIVRWAFPVTARSVTPPMDPNIQDIDIPSIEFSTHQPKLPPSVNLKKVNPVVATSDSLTLDPKDDDNISTKQSTSMPLIPPSVIQKQLKPVVATSDSLTLDLKDDDNISTKETTSKSLIPPSIIQKQLKPVVATSDSLTLDPKDYNATST
ncbi:MAG: hypothetical protein EZS28_019784, partial [Streblomastix strix]